MMKASILIVDDDLALLQALPAMLHLRMPDVHVDAVDSAQNALDHLEVTGYDAVIIDIKLPGIDGLSLLARIHERWPETPTLLITGYGEHELAVQALRGGAYDFIQKPIEREYFVASLQRAIQAHQMHRQIHDQQVELARYTAHLEQIVAERTHQLQKALAAREEFISVASHELRTPLTTVKALAQLLHLRLERAGNTEAEKTTLMVSAIRRMELLIDDLLDSSRIDAGKLILHLESRDLVELCRQVIAEQQVTTMRAITFDAPSVPVVASIDENRISQVITNLLTNAAKYSPPETPIILGLTTREANAILWVSDQGPGISSVALPHLFERFYRVPGVEVQSSSRVGLGLGLYIAREIVARHGGRLEVDSEVGKGSTFTATIPLHSDGQLKAGMNSGQGVIADA